jgi:hypothetical protein
MPTRGAAADWWVLPCVGWEWLLSLELLDLYERWVKEEK